MHLEAVIFDMDGTLFDSATVIPEAYIAAVLAGGGREWAPEDIISAYSLGPPAVMLTHLLGRRSSALDLKRYYSELAMRARALAPYRGIETVLRELRQRLPIAVFSGASREACRILLEGAGLSQYFETVVGGDEVPDPKPDPAGIVLACARLGVPPSAAAYVGDAPADIEAARRSEAMAVAAGWGHQFSPQVPADLVLQRPENILSLAPAKPGQNRP
jgi:HAD superfamily hydrolase (TIGR01509 family)